MAQSQAASSPPPKRAAMAELFNPLFKTEQSKQPGQRQQLRDEVFAYMAKDHVPVDSSPLSWWKAHESLYPNVARLVNRYLAVPATSVPSERVFSTAGEKTLSQICWRSYCQQICLQICLHPFLKKYLKTESIFKHLFIKVLKTLQTHKIIITNVMHCSCLIQKCICFVLSHQKMLFC